MIGPVDAGMLERTFAWLATLVFGKASLLIVLTLAGTRLARRSSAATRSVCWTALGIVLLGVPVLSPIMPRIDVPVRGTTLASDWIAGSPETLSSEAAATVSITLPTPVVPAPARVVPNLREWLPGLVVVVWLAGAFMLASSFVRAVARMRGLRRRATLADDALATTLASIAHQLGVRQRVSIATSHEVQVPVTGGLVRPYIILPGDHQTWCTDRLRAVLVHELAHVARWDYAGHLVFEAARTLYWPNPLVWRAMTRATTERELAADDRVLVTGANPSAYAEELLAFAMATLAPSTPRAALGIGPSAFKHRIKSILRADLPRDVPSGRAVAAIVGAAAAGLACVSSLAAVKERCACAPPVRAVSAPVTARPLVRQAVPDTLHHHEQPPTVGDVRKDSLLAVLFMDQGLDHRVAAARALRSTDVDGVVRVLVASFSDRCHGDRYRAARALRELRDARAIPDLVRQLLADDHTAVRAMLANAIAASGASEGAAQLQSAMVGRPKASFDRVARAIDTLGETRAHARLLEALRLARGSRAGA